MKALNKKQKMITKIIIAIMILVLAIIITNKVTLRTALKNNSYNATSGNSSSNLIAEYIKQGVTLGGIEGTFKGIDTSDATALPENIDWPYTAYVNGEKITGTRGKPLPVPSTLAVGDYITGYPVSYSNVSSYNNLKSFLLLHNSITASANSIEPFPPLA